MAIEDANIYHKVLDTAIMRFHSEKMKMLNHIVRELWRQTYKGNDIDYIEIKTKETEAKGETLLLYFLLYLKLPHPNKLICILFGSGKTIE